MCFPPLPGTIFGPGVAHLTHSAHLRQLINTLWAPFRIFLETGKHKSIELEVFDAAGRRIVTLASGTHSAGVHSLVWNAGPVPSGIYFLRLQYGGETDRWRCVLLH